MRSARALLCMLAAIAASPAIAQQCTTATINSAMPPRIVGLAQDAISTLLGCRPTVLAPLPGIPQSSPIYTWWLAEGAWRKQVEVQFDQRGLAASARYQEIPMMPGGSPRSDNGDSQAAAAIAMLAAGSSVRSAVSGGSVCTPATINPAAVQKIRPYMSPAAVIGALGCSPTETGPVWIFGVPGGDGAGGKKHVAVVFDETGALSAFFQVIGMTSGSTEGRLRVDPPPAGIGNWVPGRGQY